MGLKSAEPNAEMLHVLLIQRSSLEVQKRDIDRRLSEWKDEALPLLIATGTKTFGDESIGTMTVVEGTSVTINKDLLIQTLLGKGMDPDEVAGVVEAATKRSKYTTVQFKGRNGK